MNKIFICAFVVSVFLLLHAAKSDVKEEIKSALTNFITQLTDSSGSGVPGRSLPWNLTSEPCDDHWEGVTCDARGNLKNITLDDYEFSGIFNASILCDVQSIIGSLTVLSLNDNNLQGESLEKIGNCRQLTRLYIRGNQFAGNLSESFTRLNNLKRLDISRNSFSGTLPDLSRISGLNELSAQENSFSGPLPNFELSNFVIFNVSNNNFSGPVPSGGDRFPVSSYSKTQLCGSPLPNNCPLPTSSSETAKGGLSKNEILMFSGYFLIGLTLVILLGLWLCRKRKKKEEDQEAVAKVSAVDDSTNKPSYYTTADSKDSGVSKSEGTYGSGDESTGASSSLVALADPEVNGLKFENLLRAPAELLGRGKHGSVYKVFSEDLGKTLAVKRIKEWTISSNDFKQRMRSLGQVKHPNVLPVIAFYSSRQEKLLVYEYQQNGSLFRLLHGHEMGKNFDWSSRLSVAATLAGTIAFMHRELSEKGIAHGNLKSSNILLNKNMEACISEYGLVLDSQDPSLIPNGQFFQGGRENHPLFKSDVHSFGVILLELLTGKLAQTNGNLDLASWVLSVVKEEWTVEVFDRTLIQEGANEERMVSLLQIGIKCVNRSPDARPSITQVSLMIRTLKEEEDKSMDASVMTSSFTSFSQV